MIAALIWRDGLPSSPGIDPEELAAAIKTVRQGGIGVVEGPYGPITMGLGRRPGIVDPADDRWFWQRTEGLGPRACRTIAHAFLDQPDLVSLRIGPVAIRSATAIPTACADHDTVSRVLSFGENL